MATEQLLKELLNRGVTVEKKLHMINLIIKMKGFISWFDTKDNKGWHDLMTNQIYTAVLGSIIYMFFDWGYKVINYQESISSYNDIFLRTSFLFVGIIFYISDFYYIKGSEPYRKWHFLLDLIFMGCMLYSAKLLNIDSEDKLNNLPPINIIGIVKSYLIFLTLYLLWDIRELIAVWNAKKDQKEYYFEVLLWEIISISLGSGIQMN
jgi:hypothetical protein